MKKKLLFSFALLLMSISSAFAALGDVVTSSDEFETTYKSKILEFAKKEIPMAEMSSTDATWVRGAFNSIQKNPKSWGKPATLDVQLKGWCDTATPTISPAVTYNDLKDWYDYINELMAPSEAATYTSKYKAIFDGYINGTAAATTDANKQDKVNQVKNAYTEYNALYQEAKAQLTWIPSTSVAETKAYFQEVLASLHANDWLKASENKSILDKVFKTASASDATTLKNNYTNAEDATKKVTFEPQNTYEENYSADFKAVNLTKVKEYINRVYCKTKNITYTVDLIGNICTYIPAFAEVYAFWNTAANKSVLTKKYEDFDLSATSTDRMNYNAMKTAYNALITTSANKINNKAILEGTVLTAKIPAALYANLGFGCSETDHNTIHACYEYITTKVGNFDLADAYAVFVRTFGNKPADWFTIGGTQFNTQSLTNYNQVKGITAAWNKIKNSPELVAIAHDNCNATKGETLRERVANMDAANTFFTTNKTLMGKIKADNSLIQLTANDYPTLKRLLNTFNALPTTGTVTTRALIASQYIDETTLIARINEGLNYTRPLYLALAGTAQVSSELTALVEEDIHTVKDLAEPFTAENQTAINTVKNRLAAFNTTGASTVVSYVTSNLSRFTEEVQLYVQDLSVADCGVVAASVFTALDNAYTTTLADLSAAAALYLKRVEIVDAWKANYYDVLKDVPATKDNLAQFAVAKTYYENTLAKDAYFGNVDATKPLNNFHYDGETYSTTVKFYDKLVKPIITTAYTAANNDDKAYYAAEKWMEIATAIMENECKYSTELNTSIEKANTLYTSNSANKTTGALNAAARTYVEESGFDKDAFDAYCEAVAADYMGVAKATIYHFITDAKTGLQKTAKSVTYGNGAEGQEMSWIDFTAYVEDLHTTSPNAIAYVAKNMDRELPVNVVGKDLKGKTYATAIELTDGLPFYVGTAVTNVEKLTLKKSFRDNSNLANFFVPFAVDETNLKTLMDDGYKFGYLTTAVETDGVDGKKNVDLKFRLKKDGDHLAANMPYVVIAPKAGNVDIELSNVSLAKYNANAARITCASTSANYTLKGLYCQTAVERGDKNWMLSNSSSFIYLASSDENPTIKRNAGTLVFEIEAKNDNIDYVVRMDLDDEATGIETIATDAENQNAIYTINGVKVKNMSKAGIYVVNGKKFVVK